MQLKLEAFWVLCNMSRHCSWQQIDLLIHKGLLELLAENLRRDAEPTLLVILLEALDAFCTTLGLHDEAFLQKLLDKLLELKLLDEIEELQQHKNDNVYRKAYRFITTFADVQSNL